MSNLSAFLRVIREGETTQDESAYRMVFGGSLLPELKEHPGIGRTHKIGGKEVTSTAAGAYQFLKGTWEGLQKKLHLPDFSPESQDRAAIQLLKQSGAYDEIQKGNFEEAVSKSNRIWASLPGSPYGQPTITMERARETYEEFGGTYNPERIEPRISEEPMALPWKELAFGELLGIIPEFMKIKAKGQNAKENAQIAEMVVDVAKGAIQAKNEQELIDTVRRDPDAREAVRTAVGSYWFSSGNFDFSDTREFSRNTADIPVYKLPAFVITLLLLPLVYFVVYTVMTGTGWDEQVRAMVVASVISGVLGAIVGFWLGTSLSSDKKTNLLVRR